MPFHKSNDYKLTAVQYYSFMRPFEKPFVENLFINIIKGKYVYRWDVLNI